LPCTSSPGCTVRRVPTAPVPTARPPPLPSKLLCEGFVAASSVVSEGALYPPSLALRSSRSSKPPLSERRARGRPSHIMPFKNHGGLPAGSFRPLYDGRNAFLTRAHDPPVKIFNVNLIFKRSFPENTSSLVAVGFPTLRVGFGRLATLSFPQRTAVRRYTS